MCATHRVGFCTHRHLLASGAGGAGLGRRVREVQGLTSPGAIPAGHVGSPSRGHPRRRPPGLSRGEACLGSASGVLQELGGRAVLSMG